MYIFYLEVVFFLSKNGFLKKPINSNYKNAKNGLTATKKAR